MKNQSKEPWKLEIFVGRVGWATVKIRLGFLESEKKFQIWP